MAEDGLKAPCPQCGAIRNATVIAEHKEEINDDAVWGRSEFYILKCLGCGTAYFKTYEVFSENIEYEDDGSISLIPEITYWPKFDKAKISIRQIFSVPSQIHHILDEICKAINNDLFSLAAMGIRAALEQIMIDRVGDQGTFIKNVDAFQNAGYLSVRQRNDLEALLEAGHAAIHRGWQPSESDVVTLWEITTHVVDGVYIHQARASRLEETLPPRQRPRRGYT